MRARCSFLPTPLAIGFGSVPPIYFVGYNSCESPPKKWVLSAGEFGLVGVHIFYVFTFNAIILIFKPCPKLLRGGFQIYLFIFCVPALHVQHW
jgi:hypothetical protein